MYTKELVHGALFAVPAIAAQPLAVGNATAAERSELLRRGKYQADIMDCTGCHTGEALAGASGPKRYLAGSEIGFHIPGLGIFYPPNLTSDSETGLGSWSEADIVLAVRGGQRSDGRKLAPVMPWASYKALSDNDAAALAAYLKSLPAFKFQVPGPYGESEVPADSYLAVVAPKQPPTIVIR